MLKKDLRSALMKTITEEASKPTQSQWERAGTTLGLALATAMAGPMIDNFVGGLSPFQCIRGLARLNLSGENLLAELRSAGGTPRPSAQRDIPAPFQTPPPKPALDWRKELKLRRSSYSVEYGYAKFEGEVENVGTHTIKSLTLHVYLLDRGGKEIGRESQPIIGGFGDPMRPGYIKPFSVMTKAVSDLGDNVKYTFAIGDYE